jgi:hypothetical protein
MPVQKQTLNIPFALGLDTKNDPWQIAPGNFLALENALFQRGNALKKRNGFETLVNLPSGSEATTLTTFKSNLTAIGNNLYSLSDASNEWQSKGRIQPISLATQSLVRTAYSISAVDTVISENNLSCTVFLDGDGVYKYQINDYTTGETLVNITPVATGANQCRVFYLGNYFVITFLRPTANRLSYIAIPSTSINTVIGPTDLSAQVLSATTGYDGYVINNTLYVAWTGNDGGGAIRVTRLTSTLSQLNTLVISGYTASRMSVTAYQPSAGLPVIWVTAYNGGNGYSWSIDAGLLAASAARHTMVSVTSTQITSVADNSGLTLFYQLTNTYTYTSARTDIVYKVTCTLAGTVSSPVLVHRNCGLGSKAFFVNDTIYVLVSHEDINQSTYFLLDSSGYVVAKLAYSNGGGYYTTQVLPSVNVAGDLVQLAYLYKTLVIPANKSQASATPNNVYAQIGCNLVTFNMRSDNLQTEEVAQSLNIAGGFLWMYDGVSPSEQGFHLFPDNIFAVGSTTAGSMSAQQYFYAVTYEWTDGQGLIHRSAPSIPLSFTVNNGATFTGDTTSGSNVITDISSFTNLQIGQLVTSASHLPANTYITAVNSPTSITVSNNALTTTNNASITATKIGSVTLNIPTLRFTAKDSINNVRIVVYRWSVAQPLYYQVTPIASPLLNNTSVDSVTFTDTYSDAQIIGNNLLYTTGGVVENIATPATSLMVTFNNRLFVVSDEDRNTIWYSKQILASTPVEFSDLFTIYVAPTSTSQGSNGHITAISAMDDKLIIFKTNSIYYLTGNGPDITGQNNDFSDPVFITGTVGCINANSIVFTPNGIFFQSNKGVWVLNRNLSTEYVGAPVEGYNTLPVSSGLAIPATNEVRMSVEPGVSMTIYKGLHTLLNASGAVLQESPNKFIDGGNLGTMLLYDYYYQQWGTFKVKPGPVSFYIKTAWFNLAGVQGFERSYWMTLLGNYYSPHKLNITVAYDYNDSPSQNILLTSQNYSPNYGDDPLYGNGSPYGGPGNVEQWRVFFDKQKCQSFQLTIQEIFDPQYNTTPGFGVQLSGINLVMGLKSSYPRLSAGQQRS